MEKLMVRRYFISFVLSVLATSFILFLSGCEKGPVSEKTTISVWFHTGRPEEKRVIEGQVARFNESQDTIRVELTLIPEGDYNLQVQSAAADGKLPDLLDLDGPYLYNYAWKGHLMPIDDLLPADIKSDLLPSIIKQGTYEGKLYSIGTFDSGLGLYASREKLAQVGARISSSPQDAWTADEFEAILSKLAAIDPDGMVLDIRLDYRGEWYTYAFSPIIQSAGADLIDRSDFQTAVNVLNSPEAVRGLTHLQQWLNKGYIDPNTDTQSFVEGNVALSWCGHWEYPRYLDHLADDLILLPLPDFGTGSKTGMGSWNWSITSKCKEPGAAMEFLGFLLKTNEVLAMTNANGAVPATGSAIAASDLYGENGPLHLFVSQLRTSAVPRPQTPAYPVITSAFQQAFLDIRNNVDVKTALDKAVAVIEEDLRDNEGYRQSGARGQGTGNR